MTNSKVCVLGAGSTKYGKLNENIIEIALNAAKDAIESAGITPKEIQAGYISNVFGVADKQVHMAPVIMSNLGISHVPGLTIESACGSGSVMFREAYANVAAGFYDCLLALGVEKVTHTGTVHSTTASFGDVLTDDPAPPAPLPNGSTDPTVTQVDLYDTTTAVISSGSPSVFGDSVTFTATVQSLTNSAHGPG